MTQKKNQPKKTVSAKALLAQMDALAELARQDYIRTIQAAEAKVAEAHALRGTALAEATQEALPQRDELSRFIAIYGDHVIPAHAAVKAAAAKDDLPTAKDEADKMLNGLEALAAISPDLAEKFEVYGRRLATLEANDTAQDDKIKALEELVRLLNDRIDYINHYLGQATSGKGFKPFNPSGSPVAPVVPSPVPQNPDPTTDPDSLAAAAAAQTDDTEPSKKGSIRTFRERLRLGGGGNLWHPRQYIAPRVQGTDNQPATAGGAH